MFLNAWDKHWHQRKTKIIPWRLKEVDKKKRMESKNISFRAFESVAYNFHFKKLLKNGYNLSRGCYVAIYGKISVIL